MRKLVYVIVISIVSGVVTMFVPEIMDHLPRITVGAPDCRFPTSILSWHFRLFVYSVVVSVFTILMYRTEIMDYLITHRKIYQQGIDERDRQHRRRTQEAIKAMQKNPYARSIEYDAAKDVITASIGIPRTWKRRAVQCVVWLANHRSLPMCTAFWICERLGYKRKGSTENTSPGNYGMSC